MQVIGVIPNKVPSKSRLTQKDEVALAKLYDKDGPTGIYMSRFWLQQRNCYRVMERPSVDESHFNYVHNHHAIDEMQKLYELVTTSLWGSES